MVTRESGAEGFTLTELLIVIVVTSIAGLVLSGVLSEAVRTYAFVDVEKDLVQESRYAKERMTREVMAAPRRDPRGGAARSRWSTPIPPW
jgi:prepilin-type N-terminal cleavage/methylation domain-containing protein